MVHIKSERQFGILFFAVGAIGSVVAIVIRINFPTYRLHDTGLHGAIEGAGAALALVTGLMLTILQRQFRWTDKFRWAACSLIGMGAFSAMHTFFSGNNNTLFFFELSCNLWGSLLASLCWLPEIRPHNFPQRFTREFFAFFGSLAIGLLIGLNPASFPSVLNNGGFNLVSAVISSVCTLLFLLAALKFLLDYQEQQKSKCLFIGTFFFLSAVTSIFPIGFVPWGPLWWSWHALQLFAYFGGFALVALIAVQLEGRLQKSERETHELFEQASEGILVTSFGGDILAINPAACEMLGYQMDELSKVSLGRLLPRGEAGEPSRVSDNLEEWAFRKKNGTLVPVEVSPKKLLDGRRLFFLRNISVRKSQEKQIKVLNEELQRSNEDLNRFAHMVSHDMQQPLRMISMYLSLIEKKQGKELSAECREFMHFAVEGASRLQRMIVEMLKFSQLTDENIRSNLALIDLGDVVKRVLVNVRPLIDETGAVVTVGPLPKVETQPTLLAAAVQNLIVNGIKYHGPEIPRVHIEATPGNSEWILSVKDNGVGIPREHHETVFHPLRRLHGAEVPGTGMGLAAAKRIVERLGGRLWLDSTPNHGATFYLSIPFDNLSLASLCYKNRRDHETPLSR